MNSFTDSLPNADTTTENGCPAFSTTKSACLDLFSRGASLRGDYNVFKGLFLDSYGEDKERALRILQWVRDVRGGAGERQLFRQSLFDFVKKNSGNDVSTRSDKVIPLLNNIPEIGRWDDLVGLLTVPGIAGVYKDHIVSMVKRALEEHNGLCAKWLPRKGPLAVYLTKALDLTPRQYRKLIVANTNVVETKMCAKEWESITFSQVPSQAARIYSKAFERNAPTQYTEYVEGLANGTQTINAATLFPYQIYNSDVVNKVLRRHADAPNPAVLKAMWEALPNYIPEGVNVLPMIDTSASMNINVSGSNSISAMDVAISLGIYTATKSSGAFKDVWCTFSRTPQLRKMQGATALQIFEEISRTAIVENTDIEKAFKMTLEFAQANKVPQKDMPSHLLIFSDMQFDSQVDDARRPLTTHLATKQMYETAGYEMPKVIYWNLANEYRANSPVEHNERDVFLVSGFSPAIAKSVLSGKCSNPLEMMDEVIMIDRYKL